MSFQSGTSMELMYQSIATGTQLNTFTTEDNLQKTLPHCIIPAGFFSATNPNRAMKVKAYCRVGATGTPTFTLSLRLLTSTAWSAAGVVWSTAAIPVVASTLALLEIDFDLLCSSLGAGGGANTTLKGLGDARAGALVAALGGVFSIPASNTSFSNTIDAAVTQYLYLSAACSASSASNLIQLEMLKVYGEN